MLYAADLNTRRQILGANEDAANDKMVIILSSSVSFLVSLSIQCALLQGTVAEIVFDSAIRAHPGM